MTSEPNVEIVTKNPDLVGECPVWDPEQRALLWTDNRSERIYRYVPSTGVIDTVVEGVAAYAFTLQQDGSLLLFLNGTRIAVARDGVVETVVDNLSGEEDPRFNDVLVDSRGRVIGGVLPTEGRTSGSLYSIEPGGAATKFHGGMELPNGMALSADERVLYVADTRAKHILAFDYDIVSGGASNARTFIDFASDDGGPDGITLDVEGCMWVAAPGTWAVTRYGPDGALLQRVTLPARRPTSVGFGGDDMGTLFVTSGSRKPTPDEEIGPEGGALFAFRPGVGGALDHRTGWAV